jgi:hypothetical protein
VLEIGPTQTVFDIWHVAYDGRSLLPTGSRTWSATSANSTGPRCSTPAEVIQTERAAELRDPDGREDSRYKHQDVTTIAICTFQETRL